MDENIDCDEAFGEGHVIPKTDDFYAKESMVRMFAIAKDATTPTKDKVAALKAILDFTKERPAQKQKVQLDKSEEWLLAVEADLKREQVRDSKKATD